MREPRYSGAGKERRYEERTQCRPWYHRWNPFHRINRFLGDIMAKIDELNDKVDELQATLDTEQSAIAAAIQVLTDEVARLTALVGAGGASDAQIQSVIDKLNATKADLEGTVAP